MPSSRWKRAVVASKLTTVVKAAPAEAISSTETDEKVKSAARTWIDGRWTRGKLITDEAFATLIAASPHVGLLQTSLPTAFAADRDLLDLVNTLVASHVASQRIRESSDAAFASMLTELDSAFADDPESRHTARTIAERASKAQAAAHKVARRFDADLDDGLCCVLKKLLATEASRVAEAEKSHRRLQDATVAHEQQLGEWGEERSAERASDHAEAKGMLARASRQMAAEQKATLAALGGTLREVESKAAIDAQSAASAARSSRAQQVELRQQLKQQVDLYTHERARREQLEHERRKRETEAARTATRLRHEADAAKRTAAETEQQMNTAIASLNHEQSEARRKAAEQLSELHIEKRRVEEHLGGEIKRLRAVQQKVLQTPRSSGRPKLYYESLKDSRVPHGSMSRRGQHDEPFQWCPDEPLAPSFQPIVPNSKTPPPQPTQQPTSSMLQPPPAWRTPPPSPRGATSPRGTRVRPTGAAAAHAALRGGRE